MSETTETRNYPVSGLLGMSPDRIQSVSLTEDDGEFVLTVTVA